MAAKFHFYDLDVWRTAIEYANEVYCGASHFPAGERFGLAGQLRRASGSFSSNIAEDGHCGRLTLTTLNSQPSTHMQLAKVIGRTTATIKHPTLNGWRLLLIQPLRLDGGPDGEPQVAIDHLGSGIGNIVIAAADGSAAREIMGGVKNTPARWCIIGQCDE